MPDENTILIIRPRDCRYCGNGYHALAHVIEEIKEKTDKKVIDLAAEDAEKENVLNALQEFDPLLVISFGHGLPDLVTGNSEKTIFDTKNISLLSGRVWHALSCLAGKLLGVQMVLNSGLAFLGYDEEWVWIAEDVNSDPYEDKYAKAFYESDNACSIVLSLSLNIPQANIEMTDSYNQWIDYWLENPDNDPYAIEIAKWLIWDRDAIVVYTYETVKVPQHSPLLPLTVMSLPVVFGLIYGLSKEEKKNERNNKNMSKMRRQGL